MNCYYFYIWNVKIITRKEKIDLLKYNRLNN